MNTVLWKINFQTLMAMMADAPRYVQGERNEIVKIQSEDDLSGLIAAKYDKK